MARPKSDGSPAEVLTPRQRAHKVLNARILRVANGLESVTACINSKNYEFTADEINAAFAYLNDKFDAMTRAADNRFKHGVGKSPNAAAVSFFGDS